MFNNEHVEIEMGDRIHSTVLATAKNRLLAARPHWVIKEVTYDRALLIERINKPGMVMSHHEERIKNELADLARSNDLDALLVFNVQEYDAIPGKGVGVWLRTMDLSSIQRAWVHSNINLTIVGVDGTVIANIVGLPEMPKSLNPSALDIQYKMIDNMRPELLDRLRFEMLEHLQKSINKRFDQLELR